MIYLDTHVVAWLFAGEIERFSPRGRKLLRTEQLIISPMVALELQYLYEIDRVSSPSSTVLAVLAKDLRITISEHPFRDIVLEALSMNWTRDPFDRIIVAQAHLDGAKLLTKDPVIWEHYGKAVW